MTAQDLVIGIDTGTGGAKALLVDQAGSVRGSAFEAYPLSTPRALWSEQDPEDWWAAASKAIGTLLDSTGTGAEQIAAIGLTGQMHGLVIVNGDGEATRPAILWNDQRTEEECLLIHERVGLDRCIAITGKPVLTGFTAPKILWVQRHEAEAWQSAMHIMLPKDFIRYRLTGEIVTDVADGSGTSLLDIRERSWSEEMLDALQLDVDLLPRLTESPEVSATVSDVGAAQTGLLEGTPVVTGAGDQAAEGVGCGMTMPGAVSVALGTSGVVFASADSPGELDPTGSMHGYCHAVPGKWHLMGCMLSAGGSLRWFRDTLGQEEVARATADGIDPYDLLITQAMAAPAGCEGLSFLPYLTGERSPHADPAARGAFVGLTLRHEKAHLARAVLEGIGFGLRDCIELLRGLGMTVDRVRISGGGSRSASWRQMLSDIFQADVATVQVTEGAAYGAALLATVGAGFFDDVASAAKAAVREKDVLSPGPEAGEYAPAYEHYRSLYPALKPHFAAICHTADSGQDAEGDAETP